MRLGPSSNHRNSLLAGALALLTILLGATQAEAYLTLIRQGVESAQIAEAGDRFGYAVVVGDFNGDGEDDLATGSPFETAGLEVQPGNVIVNYGSTHGLTHVAASLLNVTDFGIPTSGGAQRMGFSLASADLNRDGYDDLIAGAPWQVFNGTPSAGRIFIYAGSPTGPVPWVTYVQEDIGGFSAPGDYFGWSIVTGDFNNDIHKDIAIGSPANGAREGTVFVIYGTDTGPFGSTQILTGEILGATLDTGDYFGMSLAEGNVIGDTTHDLIIGAPHRDAFGENSAGVVFLVRGSNSGLLTTDNQRVTASFLDSVAASADFGTSVATIPIGVFSQIAIGEPDRYIGSARAGRVVLINGGPDGAVAATARALTQESFGGVSEDNDDFGVTLAAGRFETDSFTDLAIGAPGKNWLGAGSGLVYIGLGGVPGIGNSGYYVYSQSAIGEVAEGGDNFGASLAFGEFDFTDNGTLIVGAPGENNNTGMVHVIAPWRQIPFPAFKTAFVRDCQGDIIYAHKPFNEVFIASTTKIMTVLLACEATQLPPSDPRHMNLSDVYTVPDWVADDIGGSSADLVEGETITLENLMYFALLISGNDAAHAIGDMLYGSGGPWESLPLFLQKMNDRALELGMFDTSFNNANGFEQEVVGPDWGDHYSTAYDMEILSRAAMQNPLFREISTSANKWMTRYQPGNSFTQNVMSFQNWILNNNMGVIGSGLKGGWTPAAQTTWCVSLEGSGTGRAIATTFGTADGPTASAQAITLAALGVSDCATWQPWEESEFTYVQEGIVPSLFEDQIYSLNPTTPLSMQVNLYQAAEEVTETNAIMRVKRNSEASIEPNGSVDYGIAPYGGLYGPIRITNMLNRFTKIRFVSPGFTRFYDIGPNGTIEIPALEGNSSGVTWTIESHDGGPEDLHLTVEECYGFDVLEPNLGYGGNVFSATITRDPATTHNDLVSLAIDWHEAGGEYLMMVHSPDVTVSAPDSDGFPGDTSELVAIAPAAPNPFRQHTQIRYALPRPATVGVSIHDVSGRRVRHYPAVERRAGAWSLEWNGVSDRGESVAPGVYFYRLEVDGQDAGGGKLQFIR